VQCLCVCILTFCTVMPQQIDVTVLNGELSRQHQPHHLAALPVYSPGTGRDDNSSTNSSSTAAMTKLHFGLSAALLWVGPDGAPALERLCAFIERAIFALLLPPVQANQLLVAAGDAEDTKWMAMLESQRMCFRQYLPSAHQLVLMSMYHEHTCQPTESSAHVICSIDEDEDATSTCAHQECGLGVLPISRHGGSYFFDGYTGAGAGAGV
jgi:hypothetical protein